MNIVSTTCTNVGADTCHGPNCDVHTCAVGFTLSNPSYTVYAKKDAAQPKVVSIMDKKSVFIPPSSPPLVRCVADAGIIKNFERVSLDSLVSRVENLERIVNKQLGNADLDSEYQLFEAEMVAKYGKRKIDALRSRMVEQTMLSKFQAIVKDCSDDESDDSCATVPVPAEDCAMGVPKSAPVIRTRIIKFGEIAEGCSDDYYDDTIGYFDDAKCSSKDICAPEPAAGQDSASGVSEPVPSAPTPDCSGV